MNPEPKPFGAVRVALRVCFGERGWLNLEWMSALQDLQASEAWCPLWPFLRGGGLPCRWILSLLHLAPEHGWEAEVPVCRCAA